MCNTANECHQEPAVAWLHLTTRTCQAGFRLSSAREGTGEQGDKRSGLSHRSAEPAAAVRPGSSEVTSGLRAYGSESNPQPQTPKQFPRLFGLGLPAQRSRLQRLQALPHCSAVTWSAATQPDICLAPARLALTSQHPHNQARCTAHLDAAIPGLATFMCGCFPHRPRAVMRFASLARRCCRRTWAGHARLTLRCVLPGG